MISNEKSYSCTYLDDLEGLVDGALGVEGQLGIDLGRNLTGNDLQNLQAELDQEAVQGGVNLLIDSLALGLTVGNGRVNQSSVLGLLGSSQDQGRVGGGILGLVLADGCYTLAEESNGIGQCVKLESHTGKVT